MSKLVRFIGEYFLGTESKKRYNEELKWERESKIGKRLEKGEDYINKLRIAHMAGGKFIPNMMLALSAGIYCWTDAKLEAIALATTGEAMRLGWHAMSSYRREKRDELRREFQDLTQTRRN